MLQLSEAISNPCICIFRVTIWEFLLSLRILVDVEPTRKWTLGSLILHLTKMRSALADWFSWIAAKVFCRYSSAWIWALKCCCVYAKISALTFQTKENAGFPLQGLSCRFIWILLFLWMATAASERITWETFCYHQHSEVDVVQTSSQLIIENLQMCLFQEEKTPHFWVYLCVCLCFHQNFSGPFPISGPLFENTCHDFCFGWSRPWFRSQGMGAEFPSLGCCAFNPRLLFAPLQTFVLNWAVMSAVGM